MNSIRRIWKQIRYNLTLGKLPKNLYSIGAGSVMQPNGIKIFYKTRREDRLYVIVGDQCIINADFTFETEKGRVRIGDNVHIGSAHFICRNGITIGNDVTMAWGITLYDHDSHSIHWNERQNDNIQCYKDYHDFNGNNIMNKNWEHVNTKPIFIHDKAWIGFEVTILKGVTIGEGAVVGAKSVVTRNVEPWTVVAGNPARMVKKIEN